MFIVYMRIVLRLVILLPTLLPGAFYAQAAAQTTGAEPAEPAEIASNAKRQEMEGRAIHEIRINGLRTTRISVVERELLLKKGESLRAELLNETIQKLKNMQIFSRVVHSVRRNDDATVTVEIDLEEKWTITPIFDFGSGGGSSYLALGVYDVNFLGRFVELGAQYETYAVKDLPQSRHSIGAWYRNPRFLDKKLHFGAEAWRLSQVRNLYFPDGALQGGFAINRTKTFVFYEYDLLPWLTFEEGFFLAVDKLAEADLTSSQREANAQHSITAPASERTVSMRFVLGLGRLDHDGYLIRGARSKISFEKTMEWMGSQAKFIRMIMDNYYYATLPWKANFASKFTIGRTTSSDLKHIFYVGGLTNSRGYLDGQLRDKAFWQANIEYRIPSVDKDWLVVQHNFFLDTAGIFADPRPLSSLGSGLRFFSPKIYGLSLRIDYAIAFGPLAGGGLSVGLNQFF